MAGTNLVVNVPMKPRTGTDSEHIVSVNMISQNSLHHLPERYKVFEAIDVHCVRSHQIGSHHMPMKNTPARPSTNSRAPDRR